jgi:hypothetical protein
MQSVTRTHLRFEWKQGWWQFPLLTLVTLGAVLPTVLTAYWILGYTVSFESVAGILFWGMLTPILSSLIRDLAGEYRLTSFSASQPVASQVLASVFLRMLGCSTILACMVVALPACLIILGIESTGRTVVVTNGFGWEEIRAWSVLAVCLVVTVILTWNNMVLSLFLGLLCPLWVVRSSIILRWGLLLMLVVAGRLALEPSQEPAPPWQLFTWVGGVLLLLKGVATGCALRIRTTLSMEERSPMVPILTLWLVTAGGLFIALDQLIKPGSVPRHLLLIGAALAIPVARVIAMPYAVAKARHQ